MREKRIGVNCKSLKGWGCGRQVQTAVRVGVSALQLNSLKY